MCGEMDASMVLENEGRIVVPPHMVNAKLGNRQHVLIGNGKSFGTWTMTEILARADLIPGLDSTTRDRLQEERASLAHLQHSSLVWDVMYRYGEDITKRTDQRTADMMQQLEVEQHKRTLAMMCEVRQIKNMMQGGPVSSPEHMPDVFTLSLTIKQATDLPKMDILHGIDSYCVVAVDNLQDQVYQTQVVPKNRNPTYDANFEVV